MTTRLFAYCSLRRPRVRAAAVAAAVTAGATLWAGAALPAGATGATGATGRDGRDGTAAVKAKNACKLLDRAEITAVLTQAPLDPGPKRVRLPGQHANFTRCEWDDHETPEATQLAAFTGLARDLTKRQRLGLGVAAPGTTARDLAADELTGLGDWGAVEIVRNGTYGTIQVVKGKDSYFVSAAYQGSAAPQVTEADMLALARIASARV